jgi:hypothetical protein
LLCQTGIKKLKTELEDRSGHSEMGRFKHAITLNTFEFDPRIL